MGTVANIFRHFQNPVAELTARGWVYNLQPGTAQDTTVTSASTSFAVTDPTFIINSFDATTPLTIIPLYASLQQAGTVAGGAVNVVMEVDNASRFSSGGTAMTAQNANFRYSSTLPTGITARSSIGSAIVATSTMGIRIWGGVVGQDVSPAEGVPNELVWTPPAGGIEMLESTASRGSAWVIYTWAAVTAPTWLASFKVAIFPTKDL